MKYPLGISHIIRVINSGAQERGQMEVKMWSYLHIDGVGTLWDLLNLPRKSAKRINKDKNLQNLTKRRKSQTRR